MSDLISRKAAIELIRNLYPSAPIMPMNRKHWEEKYKSYIECEKALEQLPSAQPERKKGKWIDEPIYKQTMDGKTWDGFTYCSECQEMHEYGYRSKFCPNCGAEMRGKEK